VLRGNKGWERAILVASMLTLLLRTPLDTPYVKAAQSGTGTVTVGNVPPTLNSMGIYTIGGSSNLSDVNPWVSYVFQVTASDENQLKDIRNVTITLSSSSGQVGHFDKTGSYGFQFDNTTGNNLWKELTAGGWSQTLTYLDSASTYPTGSTIGTWKFVLKLYKTAHYEATWTMKGKVTDSAQQTATKSNGFGVNKYLGFTAPTSVSWPATNPGTNNRTADSMPANVIITANYVVKVQVKGDGDLQKSPPDGSIPLNCVYVGKTGLTDGVKLTTSYQDLYTSLSSPDNTPYPTYWFLTVPLGTPQGAYSFNFYFEVI